jgi:hypothetical protein
VRDRQSHEVTVVARTHPDQDLVVRGDGLGEFGDLDDLGWAVA